MRCDTFCGPRVRQSTHNLLLGVTALALLACACSGPAAPVRSLAGSWPCMLTFRDGTTVDHPRYVFPVDGRRAGGHGRGVRAVECRISVDRADLRSLHRPAAMFGAIGQHAQGPLEVFVDDVRIAESDLPADAIYPIALNSIRADGADPVAIRVRITFRGGARSPGLPSTWVVGEYRDLWRRHVGGALPDLVAIALSAILALLSLLAAVAIRRVDSSAARSLATIAAFLACFVAVRLHENPLRALIGFRAGPLFDGVRLVGGLVLVVLLVEVLRLHAGAKLRWHFIVFYGVVLAAASLRMAMTFGFGARWLNATNLPAFAAFGFVLALSIVLVRKPEVTSRLVAAGAFAVTAAGLVRMLGLFGLPRLPDLSGPAFLGSAVLCIAATVLGAASRYQRSQRARLLGRFLPGSLVRKVLDGSPLPRQERRRLTMFFSDLKGFTSLSDRIAPEVLTRVLTQYLTAMTRIAEAHGGTVDKFIGDAVMVFFGAPDAMEPADGAIACVSMAVEMQRKLEELNELFPKEGLHERLVARIGVNTGYATVGEFGSDERADYTVIGSDVNLAQRLESNCPPGMVLISESTHALVDSHFRCTPMEPITPKGLSREIPVWVIDPANALLRPSPAVAPPLPSPSPSSSPSS